MTTNKINTYSLGLRGMETDVNGSWIKKELHLSEMDAWEKANENNRVFAEDMLKKQDDEIAAKNKEIVQLKEGNRQLRNEVSDLRSLKVNA